MRNFRLGPFKQNPYLKTPEEINNDDMAKNKKDGSFLLVAWQLGMFR